MGFPANRIKSQNQVWNFQINNIHPQPIIRYPSIFSKAKKINNFNSKLCKWDILLWLFAAYTILDIIFGYYLTIYSNEMWGILSLQIFVSSFNKNFQFQEINLEQNFQRRLIFFLICTGMCIIKSFLLQISMISLKIKKIYKDNSFKMAKVLKNIEEKFNCKFTITRFGKPMSSLQIIFRLINFPSFLIYIHCYKIRKQTVGNFIIPTEISFLLTLFEQSILVGSVSLVIFFINEMFSSLQFQNFLNVLFYMQTLLNFYFLYQVFKTNLILPQWVLQICQKINQIKKSIKRNRFSKFIRKQKKRSRQMTYEEIIQTYRIAK